MRTTLFVMILSAAFPGLLSAAPPSCQTKTKGETVFDNGSRPDVACGDFLNAGPLVKEQMANPSDQWNGCMWSALILKSHTTLIPGVVMFTTRVSLVPSFKDSERMAITVTAEMPDHTYKTF